ncbi:hypothetical protein CPB84DRAFT_1765989 [Gymnopilus junonius]|uniref:Carbohydrate-binding module family 19 domain-containing protein n=1 Tax=Gymnopilus junonius TaxID=109634 RepID=A0A9P5NY83_GYMJU|nr:hypothetical protein CPB84DRAFT_1765989 [Gymnopilus junonius]
MTDHLPPLAPVVRPPMLHCSRPKSIYKRVDNLNFEPLPRFPSPFLSLLVSFSSPVLARLRPVQLLLIQTSFSSRFFFKLFQKFSTMVKLSIAFLGLAIASASASPILIKRIAQTIADSTAKWEQACLAAGGGQQCNPLSVTAFTTLLAAAGPCEQQDAADGLMILSKQLKSNQMIALAQIFAQQPRNSPNSVAIPYCQKAPQNPELNGLFQCQFIGSNQNVFVGNINVGGSGTIPFGHNAPLNPLGSCPANPSGPITDGTQLSDLTTNPGIGGSGAASAAEPATTSVAQQAATTKATPATSPAPAPAATVASSSGDFHLANGQAAQKLNAQFASLTADSPCTDGEDACVGTAFAQCVGGKFVTQPCGAAPETCVALPLVNSPGTSITCSTVADAEARIAATGATGGLTGSGSSTSGSSSSSEAVKPSASQPSTADNSITSAATGSSNTSGFKLQNGKDAQALNAKFAGLSADSSCTAGEDACVNGAFAQCVNGKFVLSPCNSSACFALPLVNSPGTSITCANPADALARIQATGATGGITGA